MAKVPLFTSATATVGANGEARLEIGPKVYGHDWQIERVVVSSTSVLDTEARLYVNVVNDGGMVAGTYTGNRDYNDGFNLTLQTLDRLFAVWTGGTPGATCTLQLSGVVNARGRV